MDNVVYYLKDLYNILKDNLLDFRFEIYNPWVWIFAVFLLYVLYRMWGLRKLLLYLGVITIIFLVRLYLGGSLFGRGVVSNEMFMGVFENVAFGPRRHRKNSLGELADIVERSLNQAALWDEVKDKLDQSALSLSGGQQQRLCIARVLAVEPGVILMDEPCSALDPVATLKIEDLMRSLAEEYTIVIVTHNMQQAARVSDMAAFLMMEEDRAGVLIEYGSTSQLFTNPKDKRTEDYITGRFG